jgi:hypothetical protein
MNLVIKVKHHSHGLVISLVKYGVVSSFNKYQTLVHLTLMALLQMVQAMMQKLLK